MFKALSFKCYRDTMCRGMNVKFIYIPIEHSLTREIYLILFRARIAFTWEQIIVFYFI